MAVARSVRCGFTLVEVLLVISLLGMLAVLMWPEFSTASRSEQLDESVRRMKSLVTMCRAEAMNGARLYRIEIRADGSLRVRRQADPILAPQIYESVRADWAQRAILLADVWVESVVLLPEGPPPVLVDDELVEYQDREYDYDVELEPVLVEEFEESVTIEFRPDGTSDSLRWVLRDVRGRGVEMTLDGRLGRVAIMAVDSLETGSVERPPAIEEEEEEEEWNGGDEGPWG